MIDNLIQTILEFLLRVFVHPELATVLIAILPIVEARLAIPIGLGLNLGFFKSWLFAYLGSTLIAPLLLLVLIPFIRWLASTKVFRKLGSALYDKFEKKSRGVITDETEHTETEGDKKNKRRLSPENKKMLGVFLFVAIPLPLTGVWTGCAVAGILKLKYPKALAAVAVGNLVASLIILLLCAFFEPYINYIIMALGIIAAVIIVVLIIKIILHKPEVKAEETPSDKKED